MQDAAVLLLTAWHPFYGIIGSAAATLTGLMFIVITLTASVRLRVATPTGAFSAFNTPNVVHFCAALLVAALLSAPWQALWQVGLLLGLAGVGGTIYVVIVLLRARRQKDYQPVLEDWLWHTAFPLVSYIALIVAAVMLLIDPALALFIVAAGTMLLLFIGIHNAWDNVTYLVLGNAQPENESRNEHESKNTMI